MLSCIIMLWSQHPAIDDTAQQVLILTQLLICQGTGIYACTRAHLNDFKFKTAGLCRCSHPLTVCMPLVLDVLCYCVMSGCWWSVML